MGWGGGDNSKTKVASSLLFVTHCLDMMKSSVKFHEFIPCSLGWSGDNIFSMQAWTGVKIGARKPN